MLCVHPYIRVWALTLSVCRCVDRCARVGSLARSLGRSFDRSLGHSSVCVVSVFRWQHRRRPWVTVVAISSARPPPAAVHATQHCRAAGAGAGADAGAGAGARQVLALAPGERQKGVVKLYLQRRKGRFSWAVRLEWRSNCSSGSLNCSANGVVGERDDAATVIM